MHCCSGEMLLGDKSIKPCAVKQVRYGTKDEKETAWLELADLQAALGVPNVVQCLGVFRHTSRSCLVIVTE